MAEKIKKGDFVEIDYDGFTKEENYLFDTTDAKKAIQHGVFSREAPYDSAVICAGAHQLIGGMDDVLIDSIVGEEKTIEIPVEKAFGKKDASQLKIVPMPVFKKEKINPVAGLQVSIDGMFGVVKSVSGGRVIVDFNHPLAGKDVYYRLKSKRIVTDTKEKIASLSAFELNIPKPLIGIKENAPKKFTIVVPFQMPEEIGKRMAEIIKKIVPGVDNIDYAEEKPAIPGHNHKHDAGHNHKHEDKDAHGRSKDDAHFGHNHA